MRPRKFFWMLPALPDTDAISVIYFIPPSGQSMPCSGIAMGFNDFFKVDIFIDGACLKFDALVFILRVNKFSVI